MYKIKFCTVSKNRHYLQLPVLLTFSLLKASVTCRNCETNETTVGRKFDIAFTLSFPIHRAVSSLIPWKADRPMSARKSRSMLIGGTKRIFLSFLMKQPRLYEYITEDRSCHANVADITRSDSTGNLRRDNWPR